MVSFFAFIFGEKKVGPQQKGSIWRWIHAAAAHCAVLCCLMHCLMQFESNSILSTCEAKGEHPMDVAGRLGTVVARLRYATICHDDPRCCLSNYLFLVSQQCPARRKNVKTCSSPTAQTLVSPPVQWYNAPVFILYFVRLLCMESKCFVALV